MIIIRQRSAFAAPIRDAGSGAALWSERLVELVDEDAPAGGAAHQAASARQYAAQNRHANMLRKFTRHTHNST
jgi:hypothetical protein